MSETKQLYRVLKLNEPHFGLKYCPSLLDYPNDVDWTDICHRIHRNSAWVAAESDLLTKEFLAIRDTCKCIVEIGVNVLDQDTSAGSSTSVFLRHKLPECVYLGIDLNDKSYIDNADKNIHTIRCASTDKHTVLAKLESLGVKEIDFLFIDGWHSVETMLNDWSYAAIVSQHGMVGMHDTNAHPGPVTVFDAIDETIFAKWKSMQGDDHWGLGFAQRISKPMEVTSLDTMKAGWFIGNFEPSVLKTQDFEVAYHRYPKGSLVPYHYHKIATEYNYLVKGRMVICGRELGAGDVFTIYPYDVAKPIYLEDCEIVIVKVPSILGDKYEAEK